MTDFRILTDTMIASPQITVDDLAAAKAQGVTLVVNNRPDGEEPGQVDGATIAAAARAQGMDYVAIPVGHSGMGEPQIVAMRDAVYGATGEAVHEEESGGKGKVLAYCRSGTRSTLLWALAMAHGGMALNEIAAAAARGGYDVAPVQPMMEMLSARGTAA